MIPKTIHYVWLGNGNMTPFIKSCVNSWEKVMPEYKIKCWNEKNFDINSVPWVKEAIEKKKWALAADYIRLYALYTEGGIYMDTDVKVFKKFDDFLKYDFFSSVEYHPDIFEEYGRRQVDTDGNSLKEGDSIGGLGILSALIASVPGNLFIKDCLNFYHEKHFIQEDGSLFVENIIPDIMATIAVKYGFHYLDKTQFLDNNMVLFDSSVFAGNISGYSKERSYSMHYCDGSWRDNQTLKHKLKSFLRNYIFKK